MKKTAVKNETRPQVKTPTIGQQFQSLSFDDKIFVFGEIKKVMETAFKEEGNTHKVRGEYMEKAYHELMRNS